MGLSWRNYISKRCINRRKLVGQRGDPQSKQRKFDKTAEITVTYQGEKICRGSNEAICSSKVSSRKRKDRKIERQGHAGNDAQVT